MIIEEVSTPCILSGSHCTSTEHPATGRSSILIVSYHVWGSRDPLTDYDAWFSVRSGAPPVRLLNDDRPSIYHLSHTHLFIILSIVAFPSGRTSTQHDCEELTSIRSPEHINHRSHPSGHHRNSPLKTRNHGLHSLLRLPCLPHCWNR